MNAFNQLRTQAKHKHDAALKLAGREYESTLRKIAELERLFGPGPQPASFIAILKTALAYQERPEGTITLCEAMQTVLREHGPLRKMELLVYVLESGYKTTMPRRSLTSYSGKLLRTKPHLFKREAGKWTLVG